MTVFGFTVVAVPHRFQAGQRRTRGVSPLSMFIATVGPVRNHRAVQRLRTLIW
jgi:hypothetical protein